MVAIGKRVGNSVRYINASARQAITMAKEDLARARTSIDQALEDPMLTRVQRQRIQDTSRAIATAQRTLRRSL